MSLHPSLSLHLTAVPVFSPSLYIASVHCAGGRVAAFWLFLLGTLQRSAAESITALPQKQPYSSEELLMEDTLRKYTLSEVGIPFNPVAFPFSLISWTLSAVLLRLSFFLARFKLASTYNKICSCSLIPCMWVWTSF